MDRAYIVKGKDNFGRDRKFLVLQAGAGSIYYELKEVAPESYDKIVVDKSTKEFDLPVIL